MLNSTVLSSNLRSGVSNAFHAVSSRSQLPILLNFLIEAKDGSIIISSTDLEIGIIVKIPAKVEEEGSITVPAKTFMDLVSNINQEKLEIRVVDNKLELKGTGLKTTFPTLPADDFPKLYETRGEKQAQFEKKDFDHDISRIVFAAATDIGRPALSGVLIRKDTGEEGLTIVATDGYRLSLKQKYGTNLAKTESWNLLIPARVIKELVLLKQEEKIELFVSGKSNQVLLVCGDVTVVGRMIEAEYPDYQKIIPEDYGTQATFDKTEALNAVRACSVFAREAANIVKMNVMKDKIVFSASASSVGENEVEIDAKTTGEENEIAFNARYLLELFSNIDEENMTFEMNGPLSPGVFKIEGDKDFLHLIMPIRVQN